MARRHHTFAIALSLALGLAPLRAEAAPSGTPPPPPPPPPPPAAQLPPETPPEVAPVPSSAPTTTETDEVESVFDLGLESELPPEPEDPVGEAEPEVQSATEVEPGAETVAKAVPAPVARPPLTPIGKAGWSLLLASFAVGAGASVTIGLAERERSRQRRIGVAYDLFTTQPRALPEDVAEVLEQSRRTRAMLTTVAIGLGGTAGGLLVTSVILLAVDKSRRNRARKAAVAVLPSAGGVTVRF